ncbi:hypothetical protein [Delftia sp. PS-11]|uniref:hypothetical protein n=1 Tax=Delftia sp. PS-11 TaxID=2767222 RepID=UPI002454146A|nr:hypothetical protein [Delftia sp. PS-11]KAJ8745023.1 hypothetical protein H9T68_09720 [Delftia sp. PS-11]
MVILLLRNIGALLPCCEVNLVPKVVKIAFFAVYLAGMFLLVIFRGSKYDWTSQMGPAMDAASLEHSGNRQIFTLVVLAVICAAQSVVALKSPPLRQKLFSGLLIALACTLWWLLSFRFF